MLDPDHFRRTMQALADALPYGKQMSREGLMLCWQTIPAKVKDETTNAMWTYAAGQYILDPDRPKEMPIFLAMLRYLYRLESGQPNFVWGLKPSLPQRMAQPDRFHAEPLAPYQLAAGHNDQPSGDAVAIEGLNRLFQLPEGA